MYNILQAKMNYHTYFKLSEGTLEGHYTQFTCHLGSCTYSNNKRKSLNCVTLQMYNYSIQKGT